MENQGQKKVQIEEFEKYEVPKLRVQLENNAGPEVMLQKIQNPVKNNKIIWEM